VPTAVLSAVFAAACNLDIGAASTPPLGQPTGVWRTTAAQAMSKPIRTAVDETCREVVRISTGGDLVRVRLSNAVSPAPLRLAAVTVAVRARGAAADPLTLTAATFAGRRAVEVPAGGEVVTDPVAVHVPDRSELLVSFAVSGSALLSEHEQGAATSYCSPQGAGDRTGEPNGTSFAPVGRHALVVDEVDVSAPASAGTILAVGDSLTDPRLPPDGYARWTDVLTGLLPDRPVANAAIDGNRLLVPGGYGPTILSRLDRDVLRRPGVGTLVVLAGTNDITGGATADQLIDSLTEVTRRAHQRRLRVVLLTLLPAHKRTPDKEQIRQAVNDWIRTTDAADLVVDAESVVRDPDQPNRLRPSYDWGDGLHLSEAGHRALGTAVADALR
jgi:lysophospholipase L1-like esterase